MTDTPRTALQVALDLHLARVKTKDLTSADHLANNRARASLLNDSWSHKVAAFRKFYERPMNDLSEGALTQDQIDSHWHIVNEEYNEFWQAVATDDLIEILDGGVDVIYTILGVMLHRGIPPHIIDAAMEEIHASNMTKAAEDGSPILSDTGKILKGPLYTPPQLALAASKATPSVDLLPYLTPTEESN